MELLQFAKSRRGGELIGIVVLAAGLTLGAALLTYHPDDSSAFYTSTNSAIANAIGYYGATIAWIFIGFFGFASALFPVALLVVGWNRFWGKEIEYVQTKLIGFVVVIASLPPLLNLAFARIWFRGALIAAGGYLGDEIGRGATSNLNRTGASIVFGTLLLIGILLATRISLAAIFMALHAQFAGLSRALSLQWARFTERRRKEKMKEAIVRKHLDKADAPILRLVEDVGPAAGPLVREVRGAGRFQIRKVTKADLRRAAEALAENPDPFELYEERGRPQPQPAAVVALRTNHVMAEPAPPPPKPRRETRPAKRETRKGNDALPPVSLLTIGPKQDQISDDVHKKFLDIGRLIEER
ncbi:MAG: segregation ATPase FtsK/SpoIIIE, family [Thermoanaerobaculia bacterium]|nr:segregation ATPase FtsK/SpoIIIE, family [Thermoanaerobaculia bacterium]